VTATMTAEICLMNRLTAVGYPQISLYFIDQ